MKYLRVLKNLLKVVKYIMLDFQIGLIRLFIVLST